MHIVLVVERNYTAGYYSPLDFLKILNDIRPKQKEEEFFLKPLHISKVRTSELTSSPYNS